MAEKGTERTKLKDARLARRLSQSELADEIRCSREAISTWERGLADPYPDYIFALCVFFDKNPADLDLAKDLTESEFAMLQDILKNKTVDRRQALAILTLPAFAGIDLASFSRSSSIISPEVFLSICQSAIKNCWFSLKHDGFIEADTVLNECMPALSHLAAHSSNHQYLAASLAVEAKIIQSIIALHHLDHTRQESLYLEALSIAKQVGNDRLQSVPLQWLGWLYKSHHKLPEKATHFYNNALSRLDNNALFQRSSCLYGLSGAYALNKKTRGKALDLLGEAKATMPENYAQDETDRLLDTGIAEFDRIEGIIYQNLHRFFPTEGYGQMAYETFGRGANKRAISERTESEILICQADAAISIKNLGECVKSLEKGLTIAYQINSQKRKSEAQQVLDKVPKSWKDERVYQNLVKMF